MKLPNGSILRASRLVPVALAVALLVATSTPATAAPAKKPYQGWFGAIDFALTQPESLDQHYADVTKASGPAWHSKRLVMDNDSDFTFRANAGYSWGRMGSLEVSYWGFDNTDTAGGSLSGTVYPSIFTYYGGSQYLIDPRFNAESTTKASTWDINYIRPMSAGERVTVKWLAGLRTASYEEDLSFSGSDALYSYRQARHQKSDAMGLRVGATVVFGFTDMFSMEADLAVSFMQADTKGDGFITDYTGATFQRVEANDDNIRGEIRDYGLKAVWDLGPADLFIGYEASNWDGLVTDPLTSQIGFSFAGAARRGRNSVGFNSLHGGVRWRFGGRL